jgi:hypothetical protein
VKGKEVITVPKNVKVFDGGKIQVPITLLMKKNLLLVVDTHPQFYITDAARFLMELGLLKYAEAQGRSIDNVSISEPEPPAKPGFFAS